MAPLRVLIVGCGNIAGLLDSDLPRTTLPVTHAGAFSSDGRFNVAACVEPDRKRRNAFMIGWGIPAGFSSLDEAVDSGFKCDVVSICSPTSAHAHDVQMALRLNPRLIFCEKPVTSSVAQTEQLVAMCKSAKVLFAVNYTRRWDPDISKLEADICAGEWGSLRSVAGLYNKGILNNGSHMVDLFHRIVGPVSIVTVGSPVEDYFADDPTIPAWFEGPQGVPLHLLCGHAEDFAVFELQLVFSHGVLTMEDGGRFWRARRARDSDRFKGYRMLDEGARRAGEYPRAMLQAVDNIYQAINHGEPLASTGESAVVVERLCEQVKQRACPAVGGAPALGSAADDQHG